MATSQLFLGARCRYVGKHIKGIFNDSDDGSKWCFFPGLGEICFSLAPKWVSHNGSGSQDCSTRGNPKSGAPAKKSSPNITKTPHGEDPFWACACERESARVWECVWVCVWARESVCECERECEMGRLMRVGTRVSSQNSNNTIIIAHLMKRRFSVKNHRFWDLDLILPDPLTQKRFFSFLTYNSVFMFWYFFQSKSVLTCQSPEIVLRPLMLVALLGDALIQEVTWSIQPPA